LVIEPSGEQDDGAGRAAPAAAPAFQSAGEAASVSSAVSGRSAWSETRNRGADRGGVLRLHASMARSSASALGGRRLHRARRAGESDEAEARARG